MTWIEAGAAYFKITLEGLGFYTPRIPARGPVKDNPNALIKMLAVIEAIEKWAVEYECKYTIDYPVGKMVPKVSIGAIRAGAPYKPIQPELLYEIEADPFSLTKGAIVTQVSPFATPDESRSEDAAGRVAPTFAAERQAQDVNLFEAVVNYLQSQSRAGRSARVQMMAPSAIGSPDWMPWGICGRIASRVMRAGACGVPCARRPWGASSVPLPSKVLAWRKRRRSMRVSRRSGKARDAAGGV